MTLVYENKGSQPRYEKLLLNSQCKCNFIFFFVELNLFCLHSKFKVSLPNARVRSITQNTKNQMFFVFIKIAFSHHHDTKLFISFCFSFRFS